MAESIFLRVQRVVSSGVESAAEAVERASGSSLMREAIREVGRAADDILAEREAAKTRRLHAAGQHRIVCERLATLKEQARFAMSKGREDLAQAAVARQLDHEARAERLKAAQAEAAAEETRLDESLAALQARKAQMEDELAAFQAVQREASPGATPIGRVETQVARARAAFERAMKAAGAGLGLMNAEDRAKLAEVDALRQEDEIAGRLAALRAAQAAAQAAAPTAAPPAAPPAGGKKRRGKGAKAR